MTNVLIESLLMRSRVPRKTLPGRLRTSRNIYRRPGQNIVAKINAGTVSAMGLEGAGQG